MADRTVNRRPYSVDTDVDVDYKFFNHVNWKGLCTNKNYFNLDQETFEDCKNVYVDSEGLLKSRPAFKNVPFEFDYWPTAVYRFPNDIVVYCVEGERTQLWINQRDAWAGFSTTGRYHLLYEGKLYIFTTEEGKYLSYYDEERQKILSVEDDLGKHVYIPIKNVISNNVKSELESENILTPYYRERYIYNGVPIVNPPYRNKDVTITVNNSEYNLKFTNYAEELPLTPKFTLTEDNWLNGEPLIQIRDLDNATVYLLSSYSGTDWILTYSVDGKIFKDMPEHNFTVYGVPMLSEDGSFVVLFGKDGPYAYSILEDAISGAKTFPTWQNLLTYNNASKITIDSVDSRRYHCIGGIFFSPKDFAISYGELSQNIGAADIDIDTIFQQIAHVVATDGVVEEYETDYSSELGKGALNQAIKVSGSYDLTTKTYSFASMYVCNRPVDGSSYDRHDLAIAHHGEQNVEHYEKIKPLGALDISYVETYYVNQIKYFDYKGKDNYFYFADANVINAEDYYVGTPSDVRVSIYHYYSWTDSTTFGATVKTIDASNLSINKDGKVLTDDKYWTGIYVSSPISLPVCGYPLTSKYNYIITDDNVLYSTFTGDDVVYVDVLNESDNKLTGFCPTHSVKSSSWFMSVDNNLYISSVGSHDGQGKLYIPSISKQSFDKSITYLHPISESQVAIFFDDGIWYNKLSEHGHLYYKSKLNVGLKEGGNVINSLDGRNIIFSSTQGLVYMSYEELTQSTEQVLTYLSDVIYEPYKKYNENFVKLYLNKYWLYCYNTVSNEFFVFDVRNSSWWKWEFKAPILNIILLNEDLLFFANTKPDGGCPSHKLVIDSQQYFDYDSYSSENHIIDWHITSQKLHLSTLNYTKNVVSMIINNVETEDLDENVSYNLTVKNYRTDISNRYEDAKVLDYKVNMLRTYVKRCPSRKVNQFQYTISNDKDNAIQLPLSIHSIIVKYTIGGQVR